MHICIANKKYKDEQQFPISLLGLYNYRYTLVAYKGNAINRSEIASKTMSQMRKTPFCENGYCLRDFKGLPIGGKTVIIRMKVQRYKCKDRKHD